MLTTRMHEGGEMPSDILDGSVQGYDLAINRAVINGLLLRSVARQARDLHSDTLFRSHSSDAEMSPFLSMRDDNDIKYTNIGWGVEESDDDVLAEEITGVTKIKCQDLFVAARSLLVVSGYEHTPDYLTIFQTSAGGSRALHRDDSPIDERDADFQRDILHLRGRRDIKVLNDSNITHEESLNRGDAYTIHPQVTFHGVDYSDSSLALFVQSTS